MSGGELIFGEHFALHQCPAVSTATGMSHIASGALLLMLSKSIMPASGMIDNISVAPSTSWYFSLTPFESIMLGLLVLKLFLLRYVTVLPISMNDLSNKEHFNFNQRKRREVLTVSKAKEKERLADTMFTVIRRLDMQDCLLRTLCELQAHSLKGYQVPREYKMTLSVLSNSGWMREKEKKPISPDVIEDTPILSVFEEAVKVGWEAKTANLTECSERYFVCPLTTDDVFAHFDVVKSVDVL